MRICEVVGSEVAIQPSVVSQHQRITQLVQRIIARDQQQKPTEMDMVLATRRYAQLKKQRNRQYAEQLRQQLAIAQSAVK